MKKALDIFSKQAVTYKKFRPTYPQELYDEILQFVPERISCWDCATGNGQVAAVLSGYFQNVYATDISEAQLQHAVKAENIIYKEERAEKTSFAADQFDLITVAQAMHWFDMEAFNREAYRVAKNGGIIAIWAYGLLSIDKDIDKLLKEFCFKKLGPFWNDERKHVDSGYSTVVFRFEQISVEQPGEIKTRWNMAQLEGYLNSWSSVQHFKAQSKSIDPVPELMEKIRTLWGSNNHKRINFPLYLKVGRVVK
ncbi:MAG: class I SAM-dependent methyltransferase [Eudoraea sp.]|nr:class I SAM-dependent methyltransferase [Eudoraea sp.]